MRLPDSSQHLLIVGANGSGKTQAAEWHLSNRDIDQRPWIVYNFKSDTSIDSIPHARHIELDEIPVKPGVYIVHPKPEIDDDAVENQMWAIWEKQGIGVYVDEGYMVKRDNSAFGTLLTQGRSRQNPVIILSQRPAWLHPFAISEAQFYQIFRLNRRNDVKKVEEFIPGDLSKRLPEFHSYYYDVGKNQMTVLKPVPSIDKIHATFDRRLARVRKTI